MIQRGRSASFLLETAQAICVGGEISRQYFDGDDAVQARVSRPIHLAHAARSDGPQYLVWPKFRLRRKHGNSFRKPLWPFVR